MAAYAALVSLMHIIHQLEHHPRPPISLEKEHVESLTENITFLQEFLEGYSHVLRSKEADYLESRIADAAYAAEDIIESYVVDRILSRSIGIGKIISFIAQVQKVIDEMDFIKKEVMQLKEKMEVNVQQLRKSSSVSAGSLRSSFTGQNNAMVGFDDVLYEVMDKLTGGPPDRRMIPIVGMGGIGKTTLVRNIYQNQVVMHHFDILVWVTISQEYSMRKILCELVQEDEENVKQMNEYELGDQLHKKLTGRRYLIIMDDIWNIEVWDQLKFFFPNNSNGSRIILTTRLSNLASQVVDSGVIEMGLLDYYNSWNLFSKTVFGEEDCPLELEKIAKKIVKNCAGLPLSIVVIGGLLAKSRHTQEYWEYIEENLNSIVNSEDNVLHMSYSQLPIHLKPCFLYMGVFPEDKKISVSMLIELWIGEGFLKPVSHKSLEEIAEEYLNELIDRNLILVHKLGSTGSIKYCKIHDLLRDFCLKEAQKERFYNVTRQNSLNFPQGISAQRRIIIPESSSNEKVLDALQSMSLARSLICKIKGGLSVDNFRLLRILHTSDKGYFYNKNMYYLEDMFQILVNSWYLSVTPQPGSKFPSSVCLLWNLHVLIVNNDDKLVAPIEIWNMHQLRHVEFRGGLYLPYPPSGNIDGRNDIVLENLQTLDGIANFKCGEEVVKRIPNIKKLRIYYDPEFEGRSHCCLDCLESLRKLQSLTCNLCGIEIDILHNVTFPHSLKKLVLNTDDYLYWEEDMLEKIGSLPLLQKLELGFGSFKSQKWKTVEGQFPSLIFLTISCCVNLKYWATESSHFPRLEHLHLEALKSLKEIPSEIGEIPTLKSIKVKCCSDSAVISAKKILEEQEELHGEAGLRVRVELSRDSNAALESLASPNFQVEWWLCKRRYGVRTHAEQS